ncbi:hypothetical protein ACVINW_007293 [Bradyrhizobium sp. USDA 4461]
MRAFTSTSKEEVPVMRTLIVLAFAAFVAVPTLVAAQPMTAQQYHKEKGPCACPEDKDMAGNTCGRRSAFCESDGIDIQNCYLKDAERRKQTECSFVYDPIRPQPLAPKR